MTRFHINELFIMIRDEKYCEADDDNIYHSSKCSKCLEIAKTKYREVFQILDIKTSSQFVFEKKNYDRSDSDYDNATTQKLMELFIIADVFYCDEYTFPFIVSRMLEIDWTSKHIIETLADAGGVTFSNGFDLYSSDTIYKVISIASDEDICWYLFNLKLKPTSSSYVQYGKRYDRTFQQKCRMFVTLKNLFDDLNISRDCNIISECYEFSNDIEEVKYFISWFLEQGYESTEVDFTNSFFDFGTKLFDFLYEKRIRADNDGIYFLLMSDKITLDEKIEVINHIHRLHGYIHINEDTLCVAFSKKLQSMEIVKLLLSMNPNMKLSTLTLEKLFMRRFDDDKLSFEFVTECIDFVLKNTDVTIPYNGERYNWYCFHNREYYRYNGKLYDWLLETQPKMQQAVASRKNFEEKFQIDDEDCLEKYGMTKKELVNMHLKARKRGQCEYYAKHMKHEDCEVWPLCYYYHGHKEDCHKIRTCSYNENCTLHPHTCKGYHTEMSENWKKHYSTAMTTIGDTKFYEKWVRKENQKEYAEMLNQHPWIHIEPYEKLTPTSKNVMEHIFRLTYAHCKGHVDTDEGEIKCRDNRIRFMALNDYETWGRYYCSLEHLYQIEGKNCKWYLQEPEKARYQ